MIINSELSPTTPEIEDYRRQVTSLIQQNSAEFWTDEQWVSFVMHELPDITSYSETKTHLSTFDIVALVHKADQIGLIVLNDWKPRSQDYAELLKNYRSLSKEFEAAMEQHFEDGQHLNRLTAKVAEQQVELDFYEAESPFSLIWRGITELFNFDGGEDPYDGPL